jgi:hypothetical protein
MILEYFSLGKGSITGPWERLEKFLPFYYRIITSYLKMNGMSCIPDFEYQFEQFRLQKINQ